MVCALIGRMVGKKFTSSFCSHLEIIPASGGTNVLGWRRKFYLLFLPHFSLSVSTIGEAVAAAKENMAFFFLP